MAAECLSNYLAAFFSIHLYPISCLEWTKSLIKIDTSLPQCNYTNLKKNNWYPLVYLCPCQKTACVQVIGRRSMRVSSFASFVSLKQSKNFLTQCQLLMKTKLNSAAKKDLQLSRRSRRRCIQQIIRERVHSEFCNCEGCRCGVAINNLALSWLVKRRCFCGCSGWKKKLNRSTPRQNRSPSLTRSSWKQTQHSDWHEPIANWFARDGASIILIE